MSAWYYHTDMILSCLCDIMYHVCVILHLRQVLDTEKNIWQRCSLLVLATQSVYIPKIHFKLFFEQKIFLSFFWYSEYLKCIKYHVPVILSRRRDTLYISMPTKYHTEVIVSRLCDSITQTWFGPNWSAANCSCKYWWNGTLLQIFPMRICMLDIGGINCVIVWIFWKEIMSWLQRKRR